MERSVHFRGKKCPKMYQKINRSVKIRDIGLVCELLAPGHELLTGG